MKKVLISDAMSEKAEAILKEAKDIEVDVITGMTPEELKAKIGEYHGLAVRSSTKATKEILDAATNLKVIGRAGTGVDNIDTEYATQKGVIIMNTPGGNTVTTAEHAVSMIMSLARNIPQATASTKAGKWEKKKFQGTELTGKTLGILGVGQIGSVVANRCQGLHMKVISFDPFIAKDAAEKLGITLVDSTDELYAQSDIISIHVPLTPDTKDIINKDAFSKMKKGVKLINCARGGIVNEADLAQAIKDGIVSGAALDVFETEPVEADNELLKLDEVIVTPHLGASTHEAQEIVAVAVAEQIRDYLVDDTIRNALNAPCVPADLVAKLGPYITLAEKIGSVLGQTLDGAPSEVEVEYNGDVTEYDVAPITIACVQGLLSPLMDSPLNAVNAPVIAKERGIKITESKTARTTEFASSITLTIKTDKGSHVIEGALFGKTMPRIVKLNEYILDAEPEGNLLLLQNDDKAGVIGKVGTILADKGVNIGRLHLGRTDKGGKALSLWNVDAVLSDDVLKAVSDSENIISAKLIKL